MRSAFLAAALAVAGCSHRPAPPSPAAPASASFGAPAKGFRRAEPGRPFRFPRDHASHPEYATEWWYYTGHLEDAQGRWYGFQLTFFRVGVHPLPFRRASAWAVQSVYLAHFAVTDETGKRFRYFERRGRGSLGTAGARTDRYAVHVGDWSAGLAGRSHALRAAADGFALDLSATPTRPPVIHGSGGISRKGPGPGQTSHYYSYTRMAATGRITLDGGSRPVRGTAWFDHEFGSSQLAPYQAGWDWFSLQMEDGTACMIYQIRKRNGADDPQSSGTMIGADGRFRHLDRRAFRVTVLDRWKSPHTGADYPSRWRISVPSAGWNLVIQPTVSDQELTTPNTTGVAYWEGSVTAEGQAGSRRIRGRGYVELTGYSTPFGALF